MSTLKRTSEFHISYLTAGKPLLLVYDPQVFLDPLRFQILLCNSLYLKSKILEILETVPKKDFICRFNLLNTILNKRCQYVNKDDIKLTLNLLSTTTWKVWLNKSLIFDTSLLICLLDSPTS